MILDLIIVPTYIKPAPLYSTALNKPLFRDNKAANMLFLRPYLLFPFAGLLLPGTLAVDRFPVDELRSHCDLRTPPFEVKASISDDITFSLDFSSKSSTPSYLAGIGDGAIDGDHYHYCELYVTFRHSGPVSEITLGDWNMKGTVSLGKGVIANVSAFPYFEFQKNFSVSCFNSVV